MAEGGAIVLDGSGSFDVDQPAGTLTYRWDLDGDGIFGETGVGAARGHEDSPTPTFSAAGLDGFAGSSVTVALRVTDDAGQADEDLAIIQISNVAPATEIHGAPTSVAEGTEVSLTSTLNDPGTTDTHLFAWAVTKDGCSYDMGTEQTFAIAPDDNGAYVVSLVVTDDDTGIGNATPVTILVMNVVPTIIVEGGDTIAEGAEYTLTLGEITDAGDDTVTEWIVHWGDGLTDVYTGGGYRTHVYENEGAHTVTVDLEDEDGTHAGAGSLDLTVNPAGPEVTDLGPVDFLLLEHLSLPDGSLVYRVQTTHDGTFTSQVDLAKPPKSARLKLYDADPTETTGLTPLTKSAPDENGNQRIDWPTSAGTVYYVEVYGDNADFDVRIANLLHHDASKNIVTVHGTDSDDTFEFDASASRHVTINGVRYHFDDAQVESVAFDGGDGFDMVILDDSTGDDTLTAEASHAVFSNSDQTPGFTVTMDGFEELQAYARSDGHDKAFFYDSDANDKFKSEPAKNYAKMYGGRMYNRVKFFDVVEAFSSGEMDLARLFDTRGNDVFEGQREVSWLRTDVFDVGVHNFRQVIANCNEGGFDEATLNDSALRDELHLKNHKSEIFDLATKGEVYRVSARGFDKVFADASEGGGYDKAKMWETPRDNHLEIADDWARMFSQKAELDMIYDVLAFEFVKVRASTGGNDTANVTEPLNFDLLFEDGWHV